MQSGDRSTAFLGSLREAELIPRIFSFFSGERPVTPSPRHSCHSLPLSIQSFPPPLERSPEPAEMKVRSIPFSFWSNRGLQECSCKAVGPQTCIWQNRNLGLPSGAKTALPVFLRRKTALPVFLRCKTAPRQKRQKRQVHLYFDFFSFFPERGPSPRHPVTLVTSYIFLECTVPKARPVLECKDRGSR